MAADPYGYDSAAPAWSGAWPPDPSWDEPYAPVPAVTFAPDPADVAAQAQAQAAADAMFAPPAPAPVVGQPRAVAQPFPGEPPVVEPPDADLIEIEPEADWTGLADPYADGQDPGGPPGPADGDLIELEANEAPAEPYAQPSEADAAAQLARTLSPAEVASRLFERDQAAEQQALDQRIAVDNAERKAALDHERMRREAAEGARREMEVIRAEADRLANERVDPDGWRDSRSTFQTIAMYVAGMVGGLVQSRQGGPNQGLAMINTEIEKHIAAQQTNLAHRRDMLARKGASLQEQQAFDEREQMAVESFRLGALKRAHAEIETDKQNYDPRGTRVLKSTQLQQQLASAAAGAEQEMLEHAEDRYIKLGEYNLKVSAAGEAARARRAAAGNAAAAREAAAARDERDFKYKVGQDFAKNEQARAELAQKGAAAGAGQAKDVKQATIYNPVAKGDGKGNVDRVIRNADGSELTVDDATARNALKTSLGDMATISKLVAQQKELIEKNGGEINPRSDAAKIAKSNQATIANLLRGGYKMGTLDASALKLADDIQGGDPLSFVGDASVGLEQMLVQAEIKLDSDLKAAGWSPAEGVAYKLPRYEAPDAQSDPDYDAAIGVSRGEVKLEDFGDPRAQQQIQAVLGRAPDENQALGVRDLAARAATDSRAMEKLAAVATKASNPAVKTAAAQAIAAMVEAGNPLAIAAQEEAYQATIGKRGTGPNRARGE